MLGLFYTINTKFILNNNLCQKLLHYYDQYYIAMADKPCMISILSFKICNGTTTYPVSAYTSIKVHGPDLTWQK